MKTNTNPVLDANYERLAQAIVKQAVSDYIGAILRQKKASVKKAEATTNEEIKVQKKKSMMNKRTILQIESFFRSSWFQTLMGVSVNPDEVIAVNRIRADYAYWKWQMGCRKCKNENCIHWQSERFMHDWVCDKEIR